MNSRWDWPKLALQRARILSEIALVAFGLDVADIVSAAMADGTLCPFVHTAL
jgi:hypothetical protein